MANRPPDTDGANYVECTECGHPLERHGLAGCEAMDGIDRNDPDGCSCTTRWTVKAIMAIRRDHGLPGNWRGRILS